MSVRTTVFLLMAGLACISCSTHRPVADDAGRGAPKEPAAAGPAESSSRPVGRPAELTSLLNMTQPRGAEEDAAAVKLRPKAVAEAGRMVGVQTGISWRYGTLLAEAEKRAGAMDQAFNFGPLMLLEDDALVLPPILTSGDESMRIEQGDAATSALKTFELLEDARFVPTLPNWRSYLQADGNFPAPEEPNPVLLPKNSEEKDIWRAAVLEGWNIGVEQADQLFGDNVARLVRDFRGATLYHALQEGRLVKEPNLANARLGTQVADRKMAVDKKVYRITQPAAFQADERKWKPLTN